MNKFKNCLLKKTAGRLMVVIITIFFIFVFSLAYSIWSYGDNNELIKSDAAIVLGAAVWNDEPSPVLQERINHSIWLLENNYVDKIIFTGGKSDGDNYAESEVSRDYAIKNNVDAEDILIETKSKITEENFEYAYDIATKNNLNSFIVVSDPLHMRRAITMAKNMGMKVYSSPTPSSAYKTLKSKTPFFFRELFYYIGYTLVSPFR